MSSNKKSLFKTIFTSSTGCGCSSSKARPSDVIEPIQKKKIAGKGNRKPCTSSSSSCDKNDDLSVDDAEYFTSTAISEAETDPKISPEIPISCKKIMGSIAVEKDSTDPYQDFRHSMLQMILKKQIYSKEDLQELLGWFLKLNSPSHYEVICKAFKEIRDEVISERLILQEPCAEGKSCEH